MEHEMETGPVQRLIGLQIPQNSLYRGPCNKASSNLNPKRIGVPAIYGKYQYHLHTPVVGILPRQEIPIFWPLA